MKKSGLNPARVPFPIRGVRPPSVDLEIDQSFFGEVSTSGLLPESEIFHVDCGCTVTLGNVNAH